MGGENTCCGESPSETEGSTGSSATPVDGNLLNLLRTTLKASENVLKEKNFMFHARKVEKNKKTYGFEKAASKREDAVVEGIKSP